MSGPFKLAVLMFSGILLWAFNGHLEVKAFLIEVEDAFSSLENYDHLTEVSKDKLYEVLVRYHTYKGIKHPRVVSAQVIEETGHLESDICQQNHNWYGMKCDTSCGCLGTVRGHAYYDNYEDSTDSYLCWQKRRLRDNPGVTTDEEYIEMLGCFNIPGKTPSNGAPCFRYAMNSNYERNLRNIIAKYEHVSSSSTPSNRWFHWFGLTS